MFIRFPNEKAFRDTTYYSLFKRSSKNLENLFVASTALRRCFSKIACANLGFEHIIMIREFRLEQTAVHVCTNLNFACESLAADCAL